MNVCEGKIVKIRKPDPIVEGSRLLIGTTEEKKTWKRKHSWCRVED